MKNKTSKFIFLIIGIILVVSSVVIVSSLKENTIEKTFKNAFIHNNELTPEESKALSDKYFSEENITDDEGNQEISGGMLNSFYFGVNSLYEEIHFKIAVEIDNRLKRDIQTFLDISKALYGVEESKVEEWYEENSESLIDIYGFLSYSDFKSVLDLFNSIEGKVIEGTAVVNKYSTGVAAINISLKAKNEVDFLVDILILDLENMNYYWSVPNGE